MTTAREHFLWARERALDYVDRGDGPHAIASLFTDLRSHEGTRAMIEDNTVSLLAVSELLIAGDTGARRFIEGLPVPAEDGIT